MIIAATAVKLTAGMLLPFALAASAGRRVVTSGRARILAGAAAAAAVFGVLGLVMFGSGTLHLVTTLSTIQGDGGIRTASPGSSSTRSASSASMPPWARSCAAPT